MQQFIYLAQLLDKSKTGLPQVPADQSTISTILTILYTIIGALSFLILVIAGFRYVLSQGDPAKTAEIKNQILYAIIGLVIAGSAALIVNYVLDAF